MEGAYRDLLTLAARIPPGGEGGMAHDYLNEAGEEYVAELLDTGRNPYEVAASIDADLTALEAAPDANPRALALVRQSLMAHFDALPPPPPPAKPRRNLTLILLAVIILVIAGLVGSKYANEIAITAPIDTHKGIVQRAHALQKAQTVRKFQIRNSGLIGALYGLINSPFDRENAGADELMNTLFKVNASLVREGCGTFPDDGSGRPNELSGQDLFLDAISQNLIAMDGKWTTKPANTLREAVIDYQCPNRETRPQSGLKS